MTLMRGVGAPTARCTSGDTIYDDFGPFDIGPWGWNRIMRGQLKFSGEGGADVGRSKLE